MIIEQIYVKTPPRPIGPPIGAQLYLMSVVIGRKHYDVQFAFTWLSEKNPTIGSIFSGNRRLKPFGSAYQRAREPIAAMMRNATVDAVKAACVR